MSERIEYAVTMYRPDRKRPVTRRIYEQKPIESRNARQLAGFLTHKLFGDHERGGSGTHYVVKITAPDVLSVFTIRKSEDGEYLQV